MCLRQLSICIKKVVIRKVARGYWLENPLKASRKCQVYPVWRRVFEYWKGHSAIARHDPEKRPAATIRYYMPPVNGIGLVIDSECSQNVIALSNDENCKDLKIIDPQKLGIHPL